MVQKKEKWAKIEFTPKFQEILKFYLFETPVSEVSCRGKGFKEIGWSGSSRFQMLERLLKSVSKIDDSNWIFTEIDAVEKLDLIKRTDIQYMVSSHDRGKVQSMIYAIRNALAHGSFSRMNNGWYLFENRYRNNLKARMLIAEETLLDWIKIIQTNPEFYSKKKVSKKGVKAA